MSNTIIELRHSYVTGNVPSSLANGEIAINTYDGKIFYRGGASNTIQTIERYEGPAGLDTEIQFNDSGVLGANSGLSFNKTSGRLTVSSGAIVGGINVVPQIQFAYNHSNSAFTKANNALANTSGTTFDGEFKIGSGGKLTVLAVGGDEGGEILLEKPPNGTLDGGITIDAYQNKIRIFEQGGSARGAYIDLTEAAAGVGTNLLNPTATPDTIARNTANAAFIQANTAAVAANTPSHVANSASSYANSAFTTANAATTTNITQNNSITAAFTAANSASSYANSAFTKANTAGIAANTPSDVANSASSYANSAFARANNSLDANNGGTVTGTITATSFITTGSYGNILGANVIYANTFIANTGYIQFADGSKQYTANAGSGGGGTTDWGFGVIYTPNNSTYANATTANDTVRFVGESGVVIFANSVTKTITVAAQPGAQGLTVDYGFVAEPLYYSLDYGTL